MSHSLRRVACLVAAAAGLVSACSRELAPDSDCLCEELPLPPPTSPENLVRAIEVFYNDKVRSASERIEAYADLMAPSFVFHYWESVADTLVERTWGLEEELAATRCLFERQDEGGIYSLTLSIGEKAIREPDGGYPAGWKEVRAGAVNLRLLFNPDDRMELAGGSSRFICAPSRSRWFIMAWFDPAEPTRASRWAEIKRCPSSERRTPARTRTRGRSW